MPNKTVLIADDDTALAQAIAMRCNEMGIDTVISPDGLHAYGVITTSSLDLLILDLNMPGANGLYMCEELSLDDRFAPIPVIILTGKSDEKTKTKCDQLGVHYVWKGLDTWTALKPLITKLLDMDSSNAEVASAYPESHASPVPPKLLVVDDDPDICRALRVRFEACGIEVLSAANAMQGYWTALKEEPDVVIVDYNMPDGYGNYLLGRLKEHSLTENIPIFILTGQRIGSTPDYSLQREMLSLGAAGFFTKPVDFALLARHLSDYISFDQEKLPWVLQAAQGHST